MNTSKKKHWWKAMDESYKRLFVIAMIFLAGFWFGQNVGENSCKSEYILKQGSINCVTDSLKIKHYREIVKIVRNYENVIDSLTNQSEIQKIEIAKLKSSIETK